MKCSYCGNEATHFDNELLIALCDDADCQAVYIDQVLDDYIKEPSDWQDV